MSGAAGAEAAGKGVEGLFGYATARMQAKREAEQSALAAARQARAQQASLLEENEDKRMQRIMNIVNTFRSTASAGI